VAGSSREGDSQHVKIILHFYIVATVGVSRVDP
jgi:hypothetical protein